MTARGDRYAPAGTKGICTECKHYRGDMKCKAFPDQIPIEVFVGEFDHHEEHRDDHGIQFEKK